MQIHIKKPFLQMQSVLVAGQYKTLKRLFSPFTNLTVLHKWLLSLDMLQASGLPQSWSINKQFVVKYFIVMSSYLNLKSNLWKNGMLKILLPIKQQESNFEKAVDSGKGWVFLHFTAFLVFSVQCIPIVMHRMNVKYLVQRNKLIEKSEYFQSTVSMSLGVVSLQI